MPVVSTLVGCKTHLLCGKTLFQTPLQKGKPTEGKNVLICPTVNDKVIFNSPSTAAPSNPTQIKWAPTKNICIVMFFFFFRITYLILACSRLSVGRDKQNCGGCEKKSSDAHASTRFIPLLLFFNPRVPWCRPYKVRACNKLTLLES